MADKSRTPVIVSAARTPIGKFLGALSSLSAPELGAVAIKSAIERSGVPMDDIDEVIMGNVVQGGVGQAPARQAMLKAGVPATVSAVTVNKVCGSGLKAVMLAAQAIKAGDAQVIVAGGMESMSNAPYYVYGMRNGVKLGDQTMIDGMIKDGLWCSSCGVHMGSHAEYTAEKASVTRKQQDEFAASSHKKAVAAQQGGKFKSEIAPVTIKGKKGDTVVDTDEGPRADSTAETLARLRPAFAKGDDATVTAGNASSLNDGAAAVVVTSQAYAEEKVGHFCVQHGKTVVVEYSDLPMTMQQETDASGRLRYIAGSIAIHILDREFVRRMAKSGGGDAELPFHRADKKIPTVDAAGNSVKPDKPNGVKFEMFVFDALPMAECWLSRPT